MSQTQTAIVRCEGKRNRPTLRDDESAANVLSFPDDTLVHIRLRTVSIGNTTVWANSPETPPSASCVIVPCLPSGPVGTYIRSVSYVLNIRPR
jgi:hypothetical protein